MKKALITGITGQDGSYLAEFLLKKGYEVHGIVRPSSTPNNSRIKHILSNPALVLHNGDLSDSEQVATIIRDVQPDELYNLAAQSNVGVSINMPEYTGDITGLGVCRLLEAIIHYSPQTRFYQASSSEMFGDAPAPQDENTPFNPMSPYGCAKLYAYWMTRNYRDFCNVYAVNGILFNHEAPRRTEIFVTKKITTAIANILAGKQKYLYLGPLDAMRDWGFAPEYVDVMWRMLHQNEPRDYIIGTGETHTVQQFMEAAFEYAGLDPLEHVVVTNNAFRSRGARVLQSGSKDANVHLGWSPKIKFKELVKIMVDADIRQAMAPCALWEGDAIIQKNFPDKYWVGD
jgi:GDPmannose 4,6-dehydratase